MWRRRWDLFLRGLAEVQAYGCGTGEGQAEFGAGDLPAAHLSLRRPERGAVRSQGADFGFLGVSKDSLEGVAFVGSATAGISEQGELLEGVRGRSDRGRLS